ncbi:unnamed protein product [Brassica rapa]|uniref:GOLD domain-containing protein n=1 Tax=Brassica campestris TaxID=3711 RepID=A0A8D9LW15_BRACM|nr:unnamed protein product [Brassica rapa]
MRREFATTLLLSTLFSFLVPELIPVGEGVWLNIPKTGAKCVSEEIQSKVVVLADYLVISDEHSIFPTVSVKVTSPYGSVLHHSENATHGQFAFTTQESGTYLACFEAVGNSHGNKDISINLDWKTGIAAKDWDSIARKEKIEGVELELRKLEAAVEAIHENLLYLRNRNQNKVFLSFHTLQRSRHEDCDLDTAKKVWDSIKSRYMGADRVREARLQTLMSDFERLKMKDNESIDDFFGKLAEISSKSTALGEDIEEYKLVKKFLSSLPRKKFIHIVASLEQVLDLKTTTFEDIIGRLKAYEERVQEEEETQETQSKLMYANNESQPASNSQNRDYNNNYRGRGRGGRYYNRGRGRGRYNEPYKGRKPRLDHIRVFGCISYAKDLGAPSPSPIRPLVPPAVEEPINLRIYGKELKRANITRIVYGWWYDDDIDERYADSASFDANEVDVSKMLLAKCKKQSRLKADIAQWEDCQLLSSGAVRGTQLQAGFSREEEEEERVVLLVHDAKLPPFLDNGKAVFTKQVEPVKDPTSDMAIVSRKGSGLVREIWGKQGLHKSRQRFWKLAGSNLGVEKPAEIDADTAVVGKKGEVDFRGEGKFAEHIKKKEKL